MSCPRALAMGCVVGAAMWLLLIAVVWTVVTR